MRTASLAALVLSILAAAAAQPLSAQTLTGRTTDATTEAPISGVAVVLVDGDSRQRATAVSDSVGRFRIQVPGPGPYVIRAYHIAYDTITSGVLDVKIDDEMEAEIRLGLRALELDPITVTTRQDPRRRVLREFYDRAERNRAMGVGRILMREELERSASLGVDELLRRQPFLQEARDRTGRRIVFRRGTTTCVPTFYVNGLVTTNEELNLPVSTIEGIEIYRGANEMPPEYSYGSTCGAIMIWTKMGSDDGRPFSWKRMLVGSAALLLIIIMGVK